MKIQLIPEKCIACGLCQTYSNIFDYDDDGIVIFSDRDGLHAQFPHDDNILLAAKSCPTKAILADWFCPIWIVFLEVVLLNHMVHQFDFTLKVAAAD